MGWRVRHRERSAASRIDVRGGTREPGWRTAGGQRCWGTALTGTLRDSGGYPGVFPWVWKALRVWRDNQDENQCRNETQDGIGRLVVQVSRQSPRRLSQPGLTDRLRPPSPRAALSAAREPGLWFCTSPTAPADRGPRGVRRRVHRLDRSVSAGHRTAAGRRSRRCDGNTPLITRGCLRDVSQHGSRFPESAIDPPPGPVGTTPFRGRLSVAVVAQGCCLLAGLAQRPPGRRAPAFCSRHRLAAAKPATAILGRFWRPSTAGWA